MHPPSKWTYRWRDMPHNAQRTLYTWLGGEWKRYGFMLATMAQSYRDRTRDLDEHDLLGFAKAIVHVRNQLAEYSGLLPGKDAAFIFPACADYVFALDVAIDRVMDTVRGLLLRKLIDGECTEAERTEAIDALQRSYDEGRWPNAVEELNEMWGPAPVAELYPQ